MIENSNKIAKRFPIKGFQAKCSIPWYCIHVQIKLLISHLLRLSFGVGEVPADALELLADVLKGLDGMCQSTRNFFLHKLHVVHSSTNYVIVCSNTKPTRHIKCNTLLSMPRPRVISFSSTVPFSEPHLRNGSHNDMFRHIVRTSTL